MLKTTVYIALCWLGLVCVACQPKGASSAEGTTKGFELVVTDDSTAITIYSPWKQGQVMQTVVIGPGREALPVAERIVCTSATHIGFVSELGMTDKVVGLCRPDRCYNLSEDDRKRITDIGDDMQPSMEKILMLNPDLVILYTYAQGDPIPAQVEALGIPILYCNEWTSTTPLARTEWIRVFGAVLGCQPLADSVYASVKDAYEASGKKQEASGKSIMSGMSWRGTWYVPAGGTFMGQLFRDAGASYLYSDNPSSSSIPLTIEQALQDFSQVDIWVGCEANSLNELASIDQKHTWFAAYQNQQVYNFRRRALPSGANDFWESATVHPERVLSDIQKMLAGDTIGLYYAMPLK